MSMLTLRVEHHIFECALNHDHSFEDVFDIDVLGDDLLCLSERRHTICETANDLNTILHQVINIYLKSYNLVGI